MYCIFLFLSECRQGLGNACWKTCSIVCIDNCCSRWWYSISFAYSRFHLLYNIAHWHSGHALSPSQTIPIGIGWRNENRKVSSIYWNLGCREGGYPNKNLQISVCPWQLRMKRLYIQYTIHIVNQGISFQRASSAYFF